MFFVLVSHGHLQFFHELGIVVVVVVGGGGGVLCFGVPGGRSGEVEHVQLREPSSRQALFLLT